MLTGSTLVKILLVMVLWASCFPLITVGIAYSPHISFATLRAFAAGIPLVLIALYLGKSFPNRLKEWLLITVIGMGATTFGFLGMFHAGEYVSPGLATVIANTQPLLAAVFGFIFLKEKVSVFGWIGLGFCFVGILIIAMDQLFSGNTAFSIGLIYLGLAALGITISNLTIRYMGDAVDLTMAMGLQMIIGGMPLLVVSLAMETDSHIQWNWPFIATLMSLSLLGTSLVYCLWASVLRSVELYKANSFSFLIPVIGLTAGAFFFDERLSSEQWLGVTVIVVGIVVLACFSRDRDSASL